MTILGIDPGYGRCGWGIIEQKGSQYKMIDYGCIETSPNQLFSERLEQIHQAISQLIKLHQPAKVGVEELFFAKNTKTALKVAQARGVILLTIQQAHIPIIELTPNQVKQSVTSYGGADKKQVQDMVKMMLRLAEIPKPDDAADALAIAITAATWTQFN